MGLPHNRLRKAAPDQGNRVLRGLHQDARQHTQQIVAVAPGLLPLVGDPEIARGLDLLQFGRHVAQGGQIRGKVPGSMPSVVLMENDVEHVVQTILDAPV